MYKRNEYKLIDDYVIFYVTRRNGEVFEIYADKSDLNLLKDYCWHVGWHKNIDSFYAETVLYLGKIDGKYKYKSMIMDRLIMNAPDNTEIDHIDHNGLNNRKYNLRISSVDQNSKHRKSKNKNNSSGYRNVCWDKQNKYWKIQIQIDGKNTDMGHFDDVHEAGMTAK